MDTIAKIKQHLRKCNEDLEGVEWDLNHHFKLQGRKIEEISDDECIAYKNYIISIYETYIYDIESEISKEEV